MVEFMCEVLNEKAGGGMNRGGDRGGRGMRGGRGGRGAAGMGGATDRYGIGAGAGDGPYRVSSSHFF